MARNPRTEAQERYSEIFRANFDIQIRAQSLKHELIASRMRHVGFESWKDSYVSKMLSGERSPNFDEYIALAKIVGFTVEDLLYPPQTEPKARITTEALWEVYKADLDSLYENLISAEVNRKRYIELNHRLIKLGAEPHLPEDFREWWFFMENVTLAAEMQRLRIARREIANQSDQRTKSKAADRTPAQWREYRAVLETQRSDLKSLILEIIDEEVVHDMRDDSNFEAEMYAELRKRWVERQEQSSKTGEITSEDQITP